MGAPGVRSERRVRGGGYLELGPYSLARKPNPKWGVARDEPHRGLNEAHSPKFIDFLLPSTKFIGYPRQALIPKKKKNLYKNSMGFAFSTRVV